MTRLDDLLKEVAAWNDSTTELRLIHALAKEAKAIAADVSLHEQANSLTQAQHTDDIEKATTRVDQLADQLAGLQRLVETLVNERGEGRREERELAESEELIESRTVTAIADCLERRARAILQAASNGGYTRASADAAQRAAGLTDAVDALRAGTWKEQP